MDDDEGKFPYKIHGTHMHGKIVSKLSFLKNSFSKSDMYFDYFIFFNQVTIISINVRWNSDRHKQQQKK